MSAYKYTPDQVAFIVSNLHKTRKEIAEAFTERFGAPRSPEQIHQFLRYRKFKLLGRPLHWYTAEQAEFIGAHIHLTKKELAAAFTAKFGVERHETDMHHFLFKNGLTRKIQRFSQDQVDFIMASLDQPVPVIAKAFAERFKVPCSAQRIYTFLKRRNIRKGRQHCGSGGKWFESGHNPVNRLPIGTERIRTLYLGEDRIKTEYIDIKVAEPAVWKRKHRVVWEAAYGPLPKGWVIIFADGNTRNCSLDNLLKVSREELAWLNRNRMISEDANLTRTAHLVSQLAGKTTRQRKLLKV